MGACTSRNKRSYEWEKDHPRMFISKMKVMQQEVNAILLRREEDSESYERELMLFAFKETEWKKERKRLREEVKRLRRSVEDREERIRLMEDEVDQIVGKSEFEGKSSVDSSCLTATATGTTTTTTTTTTSASLSLMEQIKEERTRRDETIEKWKMLYLAIKNELDELIQKTHQGTLHWRADEEELMEEMQRESRAKDEIIQVLKAQIVAMENEEYKRKREVDILRQSLKIMSNKKGTTYSAHVKSRSKPSIRLNKSFSKLAFVN